MENKLRKTHKNRKYRISKKKKKNLKIEKDYLFKDAKKTKVKNQSSKEEGRGEKTALTGKQLSGIFSSNKNGFGFVRVEGYEKDFYIPEKYTNFAMNGDTVLITVLTTPIGKRTEAKVEKITEHSTDRIVGSFVQSKEFGFVIPDDKKIKEDIYIPKDSFLGAKSDDKVVVAYIKYAEDKKKPEGKVIEVIGNKYDCGIDISSILKEHNVPDVFSDEVISEAQKVNKPVGILKRRRRLDLRKTHMVTIDGEHTKDFDDAVSISVEDDKFILGVHIADVTEYVKENGNLDKEALKRGTSVYLCDRVVPMLPKELSNGICSLNEHEDRLALSCIMTFNEKGDIIDSEIVESVININHRMTYHDVSAIIAGDEALILKYNDMYEMFLQMDKLSKIIRRNRKKEGCIDFESKEAEIVFDETGFPIDVKQRERDEAALMIEDFMISANETVAKTFYDKHIPFLYRTHGNPDQDKIESLNEFFASISFGVHIKSADVKPKDIQEILNKAKGKSEEGIISNLILRSMQKAVYNVSCEGHFGLATKYYCHFTSPIRRYPDLQIHRIIKEYLHKKLNEKRINHYNSILNRVAEITSVTERRADDCEREAEKMKMAEYMSSKVGEVFDGIITSTTNFGFYVELYNTIEGMVHVSTLKGDYYSLNEVNQELVGERSGKVFKVGQEVVIKVIGADKYSGTIDFELVEK